MNADDAYVDFLAFLESIQQLPLTERVSLLTQMLKDVELELKEVG